jgi:hypothetical protein
MYPSFHTLFVLQAMVASTKDLVPSTNQADMGSKQCTSIRDPYVNNRMSTMT